MRKGRKNQLDKIRLYYKQKRRGWFVDTLLMLSDDRSLHSLKWICREGIVSEEPFVTYADFNGIRFLRIIIQ
jgi:hypothetical protein